MSSAESMAMNIRHRIDRGSVKRQYFHFFLLLVAIAVCYANTLKAEWHLDDMQNIVNNQYIKIDSLAPAELKNVFQSPLARPVASLTFALNYYFSGLAPAGYHLFNIGIHFLCAIFSYLVFVETLAIHAENFDSGAPRTYRHRDIALLGAVLWAVHPMQAQAVTYIVQRMASMGAMWYMIAFYCYLRFRRSPAGYGRISLAALGFLAWIAGVLTKQNIIVLPLAIIAFEWIFSKLSLQGHKKTIFFLLGGCMLLATVFIIIFDIHVQQLFSYDRRPFTMGQRLITQPIILSRYLLLLFYPGSAFLTFDSGIKASQGLLDPPVTLPALLLIILLAISAFALSRRLPVISFAILFFFINHLVESTIIPLELYFEHRNYLASIFIYFALAFYLVRGLAYLRNRGKKGMQGLLVMMMILFIAIEGRSTYLRNSVWQSDLTLWQDEVKKNPDKARPHNNLGLQYWEKGHVEEAIAEFETALRLEPDYMEAYYNLGVVYFKQGRYAQALRQFENDVKFRPDHAVAYSNMGVIYTILGRTKEAINSYNKAIAVKPDSVEALANLGLLYAKQENFAAAVNRLRKALAINPDIPEIHYNLAMVYFKQGRSNEAIVQLRIALALRPDYQKAGILLQKITGQ